MNEPFYRMRIFSLNGKNFLGFLKAFDPELNAPDYPTGAVEVTPDPGEAILFKSQSDAFVLWRARSKSVPNRPDGYPNRPLTAYSIQIEMVPDGS